ncbi:hypothetical protein FEE96_04170 [Parasedimentitalea maritima]|uniref:Uncharacterized protein n=2 Tax=Parasedimentitalea maritima TaxID=2578117 RepID=A0ABY2UXY5_9RHOB|nr:hypothetical protein FEE96_04170 [Zongyanglinia marina]
MSVAAAAVWIAFGSHIAGLYRYATAGFPEMSLIGTCPLSLTYYGFEEQELVSVTCIGRGFP